MKVFVLLVVCLVGLGAAQASAGVIGTWMVQDVHSSTAERPWKANMCVGQDMTDWTGRTTIFNGPDADGCPDGKNGIDLLINVGRTFWVASNEDDPEFELFVSRITDGIPDNVQACFGDGGGGVAYWIPLYVVRGWPDQGSYNYDYADLSGYLIDRIGLTVDSASCTYVSGSQYPYHYECQVTYTFEGTPVPEPASFAALAAGTIALGVLRLRRRPRSKKVP